MTKLRLKVGKHAFNGPDGTIVQYSPGDVFEYPENLATRWPNKFEEVDDHASLAEGQHMTLIQPGAPSPPVQQTAEKGVGAALSDKEKYPASEREYLTSLERMTVKELTIHAAEGCIDLKGVTGKNEIIRLIREALVGVK